jgi:hypothetical protein
VKDWEGGVTYTPTGVKVAMKLLAVQPESLPVNVVAKIHSLLDIVSVALACEATARLARLVPLEVVRVDNLHIRRH